MLTIGSLCSGIGGLELGLEWAGFGPVGWQVEIDEYCRRVLARHWPAADRSVVDVREAGAASLVSVDLICGGFPCQDVSGAGRGAGLGGARSGLWWECRRVVAELRPRIVVVENVASGTKRWLCAVRGSLHELGYRTRALGIGASDVGAPHLRRRIFVVAYADGPQLWDQSGRGSGPSWPEATELGWSGEALANAAGSGREGTYTEAGQGEVRIIDSGRSGNYHANGIESGLGRDVDGIPARLDGASERWPASRGEAQHPWEPPRTLADVPRRAARLRALGNAVVPQCAYVVGLAIWSDLTGTSRRARQLSLFESAQESSDAAAG